MRDTIEDIVSSAILLGLITLLAVCRRRSITLVFQQSPLWIWFLLLGVCLVQIPGAFLWPNQVFAPWFIIRGQASVVLVIVCEALVCSVLGYRLYRCQYFRLRCAITCTLIFLLGVTAAAIPAYFLHKKQIEIRKHKERAVGALYVAEMHARAFEIFLSRSPMLPVDKMKVLAMDGLKVHKQVYEDLCQEGTLGPVNGFTRGYDKTCAALQKLRTIQEDESSVSSEGAPSKEP